MSASQFYVPTRVVLSGSSDSVLAAKDKFVNNDYAILPLPDLSHYLGYNIRYEVARTALISFIRTYPVPIAFTGGHESDHELIAHNGGSVLDTDDFRAVQARCMSTSRNVPSKGASSERVDAQRYSPLRVILSGSPEAVLAVREYIASEEFAIMPIPSAGAALRSNVSPDVCRGAMSSMMRCYPLPIVFTGGNTFDHNWIVARRGVLLNVSEEGDFEVRASFDESSPYWSNRSNEPFVRKLQSALGVCQMISRDFQSHQIPPAYSAFATC